jgi:hypothetical protein
MTTRRASILVLFCLLCLTCPGAFGDTLPAVPAASHTAQSWLKLVDAGQYRQSYKDASSYFQSRISERKWVAKVKPVRAPLGALVSRNLHAAQYTTTLPGAPDGKYVVMQFDTSFQHKKSAVETVTAMMEPDGQWRVCGYFIR